MQLLVLLVISLSSAITVAEDPKQPDPSLDGYNKVGMAANSIAYLGDHNLISDESALAIPAPVTMPLGNNRIVGHWPYMDLSQ